MDLSAVNDQQLNDITVGMNWYLNPHSRLMFNWVHPIALNSLVSDLETAEGDALSARFQVDF
jgi:phosphate-selective porin